VNEIIKKVSKKLQLPTLEFFYREGEEEEGNRIYVNLFSEKSVIDSNIREKFKNLFKQDGIQVVFFHRPRETLDDDAPSLKFIDKEAGPEEKQVRFNLPEEENAEVVEKEESIASKEESEKKQVRFNLPEEEKAEVVKGEEDDSLADLPKGEIDEDVIVEEGDSAV